MLYLHVGKEKKKREWQREETKKNKKVGITRKNRRSRRVSLNE